ncbi:MAG: starch-binding protein [Ruminococcus sp.]|nr:starch-binding protein [Ruminococcus sp.]
MFKKIISLMVAILIVASCAVVAVSAAEVANEEVGAGNTIYFEVPSDWKNYTQIYAHVYMSIDDGSVKWPSWQTRKEKMTDEGNGTWSYDLSNAGTIDPNKGAAYTVLFSADTGVQTYNLIFGADCIGDTAYATGKTFENPEDSNKTAVEAAWKSGKYGPERKILSTGNDVVGTQAPAGTSDAKIMASWVKNFYGDATKTPNIPTLLTKLNVTGQDVYDELVKLVESDSGLGDKEKTEILKTSKELLGAKDTDTNSNNGSSNNNSSNGSSNNSSNNSGSNSGSGNNNSVSSGQDSTILFVLGGVMLAAVAVLFVTRKRED